MWPLLAALAGMVVAAGLLTLGFYLGMRTTRSTSTLQTQLAESHERAALALERSSRLSAAHETEMRRVSDSLQQMDKALDRQSTSILTISEVLIQTGRARESAQVGEGEEESKVDPATQYWRAQGRAT